MISTIAILVQLLRVVVLSIELAASAAMAASADPPKMCVPRKLLVGCDFSGLGAVKLALARRLDEDTYD